MSFSEKLHILHVLAILSWTSALGENSDPIPIQVQDKTFYAFSEAYLKYKEGSHSGGFGTMVSFAKDEDPVIKDISNHLVKGTKSKEKALEKIFSFVEDHVTYQSDSLMDPYESNYIRHPLETLIEGKGDCEEFAILFASLVKAQGWDVCLFHFYNEKIGIAHVAAGVTGKFRGWNEKIDGKRYFIVDSAYDKTDDKANFKKYGNFRGLVGKIDKDYMFTKPLYKRVIN